MNITNKAKNEIFINMAKLVPEYGRYLRVAVVGGGCSGLSYKLSFEDIPNSDDNQLEFGNLFVLVDKKSMLFLQDVTIDFSDGLNGTGFTFNNSKASRTCGCGTSFNV